MQDCGEGILRGDLSAFTTLLTDHCLGGGLWWPWWRSLWWRWGWWWWRRWWRWWWRWSISIHLLPDGSLFIPAAPLVGIMLFIRIYNTALIILSNIYSYNKIILTFHISLMFLLKGKLSTIGDFQNIFVVLLLTMWWKVGQQNNVKFTFRSFYTWEGRVDCEYLVKNCDISGGLGEIWAPPTLPGEKWPVDDFVDPRSCSLLSPAKTSSS